MSNVYYTQISDTKDEHDRPRQVCRFQAFSTVQDGFCTMQ